MDGWREGRWEGEGGLEYLRDWKYRTWLLYRSDREQRRSGAWCIQHS